MWQSQVFFHISKIISLDQAADTEQFIPWYMQFILPLDNLTTLINLYQARITSRTGRICFLRPVSIPCVLFPVWIQSVALSRNQRAWGNVESLRSSQSQHQHRPGLLRHARSVSPQMKRPIAAWTWPRKGYALPSGFQGKFGGRSRSHSGLGFRSRRKQRTLGREEFGLCSGRDQRRLDWGSGWDRDAIPKHSEW